MNDKIIAELKRIANEHDGILQPVTVVKEAEDRSSPLHSSFEWNNSKAADAWRLQQARQLISVCVETVKGSNTAINVFVSLTPDRTRPDGGYRLLTSVLSDEQTRTILLQDALREMELFTRKYEQLKDLAPIFSAIQQVAAKSKQAG